MKKELIYQNLTEIEKSIRAAKKFALKVTAIASKLTSLIGRKPTREELEDFQSGGSLITEVIQKRVEADLKKFSTAVLRANFQSGLAEILGDVEALRIELGAVSQEITYPYRYHSISAFDYKDGILSVSKQFEASVQDQFSTYVTPGSKRSAALQLARTAIEAINDLDAFIKKELDINPRNGRTAVQALENQDGAPGLIDYWIDSPDQGKERAFLNLDRFNNIPDQEEPPEVK